MRKPKDLTNLNADYNTDYTENKSLDFSSNESGLSGDSRQDTQRKEKRGLSNLKELRNKENQNHNENREAQNQSYSSSHISETKATESYHENETLKEKAPQKKPSSRNKSQTLLTYVLVLALIIAYNLFFKK